MSSPPCKERPEFTNKRAIRYGRCAVSIVGLFIFSTLLGGCSGNPYYLADRGIIETHRDFDARSGSDELEPALVYGDEIVNPLVFYEFFGTRAEKDSFVVDLENEAYAKFPAPTIAIETPAGERIIHNPERLNLQGNTWRRVWIRGFGRFGEVVDYDHLGHLYDDHHAVMVRFSGGTMSEARLYIIRQDGARLHITGWLPIKDLVGERHIAWCAREPAPRNCYVEVIDDAWDDPNDRILLNKYLRGRDDR